LYHTRASIADIAAVSSDPALMQPAESRLWAPAGADGLPRRPPRRLPRERADERQQPGAVSVWPRVFGPRGLQGAGASCPRSGRVWAQEEQPARVHTPAAERLDPQPLAVGPAPGHRIAFSAETAAVDSVNGDPAARRGGARQRKLSAEQGLTVTRMFTG